MGRHVMDFSSYGFSQLWIFKREKIQSEGNPQCKKSRAREIHTDMRYGFFVTLWIFNSNFLILRFLHFDSCLILIHVEIHYALKVFVDFSIFIFFQHKKFNLVYKLYNILNILYNSTQFNLIITVLNSTQLKIPCPCNNFMNQNL